MYSRVLTWFLIAPLAIPLMGAYSHEVCAGHNFAVGIMYGCMDEPDALGGWSCPTPNVYVWDTNLNTADVSINEEYYSWDMDGKCGAWTSGSYLTGDGDKSAQLWHNGLWYGCKPSSEYWDDDVVAYQQYYRIDFCCANNGEGGSDCPAGGCGAPC